MNLAISPDGKFSAFTLNGSEGSSLWIRPLISAGTDNPPPQKISSGKWRDRSPVWSPDGQRLAFISDRSGRSAIWTISRFGKDATLIQELEMALASLVDWRNDQGRELIYYELRPHLFTFDIASGQVRPITQLNSSYAHSFSLSPDAQRIVYVDNIDGLSFLMLKHLSEGVSIPLTPGQKESYRSPNWFPDGNKIAYVMNVSGSMQVGLVWLDNKERMQITSASDDFDAIRVLPNGQAILAISNRENADIFSCDLQTRVEREQSLELGINLLPEVSFDEK